MAGVAIDCVLDMQELFDQIPLGEGLRLHDYERRGAADPWPSTSSPPKNKVSRRNNCR